VQTVTGRVLRADGSSEPYVKLVFSRDVLAGRAVEVRGKAARLAEFARPGAFGSVDLARVVDEQSDLFDDMPAPVKV
jgi:hypothetical protein